MYSTIYAECTSLYMQNVHHYICRMCSTIYAECTALTIYAECAAIVVCFVYATSSPCFPQEACLLLHQLVCLCVCVCHNCIIEQTQDTFAYTVSPFFKAVHGIRQVSIQYRDAILSNYHILEYKEILAIKILLIFSVQT